MRRTGTVSLLAAALTAALAIGCYREAAQATTPGPAARPAELEPAPAEIRSRPARSPTPELHDLVAAMTRFRDEMCACTDRSCADAVSQELTAWASEMANRSSHERPQPSEDEIRQIQTVADEMSACVMKLMSPPPPGATTP